MGLMVILVNGVVIYMMVKIFIILWMKMNYCDVGLLIFKSKLLILKL